MEETGAWQVQAGTTVLVRVPITFLVRVPTTMVVPTMVVQTLLVTVVRLGVLLSPSSPVKISTVRMYGGHPDGGNFSGEEGDSNSTDMIVVEEEDHTMDLR